MTDRQEVVGVPGSKEPGLDDFLGEPTRDLTAWQWLWAGDRRFPVRSHRGGILGRLLVLFKRLFRPLVQTPQNDLWERQRIFNLILLEELRRHLDRFESHEDRLAGSERRSGWHEERLERLEAFWREGLYEVMRHNDGLFARVDQKMDRLRRESSDLWGRLGSALARSEAGDPAALSRVREEQLYLQLEARHRGTEAEIAERLAIYLPYFGGGEVLDLGCGRGEFLALLGERAIPARGVDSSAEMVATCRSKGLRVDEGDLLEALAASPPGGLGGIVSFHVVEHLPPPVIDRLIRLAWGALAPGGVLVLETPNPLSVVVAARSFWLDPTHVRPVHPEMLRVMLESAGFASVERVDLRPFPKDERLPEIDVARLSDELRPLADEVNRLRDRIDELLFGHRDFAMIARKP